MIGQFEIAGILILGTIIGLLELIFVHADERGLGWIRHGLHALPACYIFTAISLNVPVVVNWINQPWLSGTVATIGIPVVIGLIAAIKVKSAAAITRGHGSVGEKLGHALIIGALIALAPFIWPFIQPLLPAFLQF